MVGEFGFIQAQAIQEPANILYQGKQKNDAIEKPNYPLESKGDLKRWAVGGSLFLSALLGASSESTSAEVLDTANNPPTARNREGSNRLVSPTLEDYNQTLSVDELFTIYIAHFALPQESTPSQEQEEQLPPPPPKETTVFDLSTFPTDEDGDIHIIAEILSPQPAENFSNEGEPPEVSSAQILAAAEQKVESWQARTPDEVEPDYIHTLDTLWNGFSIEGTKEQINQVLTGPLAGYTLQINPVPRLVPTEQMTPAFSAQTGCENFYPPNNPAMQLDGSDQTLNWDW
ncbi:hypothetical protein HY468_00875, partial [Candidatus Roizmanbacteria bacterium]|nr:hypothetical protein [Candidatus Roizmanbacteria bacterium]